MREDVGYQRQCMVRAHECLRAAQALLEQGFVADAVSRAYYATFHAATAVLAAAGVFPRTHHGLRSEFLQRLVQTGVVEAEYGTILVAEQEDREESDYDVTARPRDEVAQKRVAQARRFLERMGRLLSGEVPPKSGTQETAQ